MQHSAKSKEQCALCLRKVGFGMTLSRRILVVGRATMHRYYKKHGIVTNPQRNGIALKGTGHLSRRPQRRHAAIQRRLTQASNRVARCLNKKPRRERTTVTPAERFRQRYRDCPEFHAYQLCRRRLKKLLHGVKRYGRCMELVGCTTAHLRFHIESQFKPGMTWANTGTGEGLWHIDHERPCASFDLTKEDQQRACFNWTNLRPLWSIENMRKGARCNNLGSFSKK